jgi:SWI/SNF-related matrix-associated actin-dependent regulator of chromatin subfamily A-like protein 1
METKMYRIGALFARKNKLPVAFVANKLIETPRAIYLYGHGTLETQKMGFCCICGRELTHPVSVVLGIGPHCGGHWWNWDTIGGFNENILEELKVRIKDGKVDQWIPKSIIKQEYETEESITTPSDHPMLEKAKSPKPGRTANLVKYQNSGKWAIKIEFPFNHDDLANVKSLPDRRFHSEGNDKYWTTPLGIEAVEKLREWGFQMDERLIKFLEKAKVSVQDVSDDIQIPGLKGDLFPFQKKGVAFLEAKDGRALIADEMGLGKTVQALAYLQLHPEKRPVIVVVPASLKLNWKKEARQWMTNPNVQILSGTNANIPIIGEILIINYDILPYWVERLTQIKAQVMITDECHYYKNNGANRTKAVKKLGKTIPHVIALSGTPIVNRPVEIFNALSMIDSTVMPSFWKFAHKYCGARHNGYGWDFNGATNTDELHGILSNTLMIRRKKADVLKDLPDKIRSFIPIELNNEKEYRKAESDFVTYLADQKGKEAAERASNAQALAEIEGLKQLAVRGKMDQAIEWIQNFLESGEKLVVFATHKFTIDALMEKFPGISVKVDGSVSGENRHQAVELFQNDPQIRLFVGNIKAAGVGLTLTASSNVVFLELPWTPGDLTQAEDRCHRIGQKESVTIHYLLAAGTIEEKIAILIDRKRKVLDSVLDGTVPDQESLLSELIKEFTK